MLLNTCATGFSCSGPSRLVCCFIAAWLGLTACRYFSPRWRSGTCCVWQKMPPDGRTWRHSWLLRRCCSIHIICRVSPSGRERSCCWWCALRRGRPIWKSWLLPNTLVAVLYLPWLVTLSGALGQWRHSAVYSLTGNLWAEQVLKLCYLFYSFTFGELVPIWLLPVTVLLALPCLWLFVSGARLRRDWLWPALFTATVAYL